MKQPIRSVLIDVEKWGSNIEVYRGESINSRDYPLTERNYWRAVGLQLRLAGFADDAGENPLDKKNYREEGE